MKATLRGQTITGFTGQSVNGIRYLFVNGTSSKTKRSSYAVAKLDAVTLELIAIEAQQQLGDFTNDEVVTALLAAR